MQLVQWFQKPVDGGISEDTYEQIQGQRSELDLHNAALWNDTNKIKKLIASKANLNELSTSNESALMWAAQEGNNEAVVLLLENGARTSLQNNAGLTASDLAKRQGYQATADVLDEERKRRERKMRKMRKKAEEAKQAKEQAEVAQEEDGEEGTTPSAKLEALRAELVASKDRETALETELGQAKQRVDDAEQNHKKLEDRVKQLEAEIADKDAELANKEALLLSQKQKEEEAKAEAPAPLELPAPQPSKVALKKKACCVLQ